MATATKSKNTKSKKAVSTVKKGLATAGGSIVRNPMTTVYVIGGAIAVYLLYKTFKGINSAGEAVGEFFNPDFDNSVDVGPINNSGATISIEQARIFANQLLGAMNYQNPFFGWHGTDEDTILEVFKRITPADFRLIYNVFGQKDYNGVGSPPDNVIGSIQISSPRDLVFWLNSELSFTDGEVYRVVKKIVNDAGFAF
ncbi:hypothetical protein [Aquimarina spongiae]|uniref:Uncharacterized protein n=1 Tax=Aquimarina spongiae TaxID=570521 RepID=A0A1M6JFC4_9FLAO|nr:hypothetical protein [Aquimarina spongiae]SHJ45383.1 hypothetical protein SAMN04488508_10938 [Aquimarina spongiae]